MLKKIVASMAVLVTFVGTASAFDPRGIAEDIVGDFVGGQIAEAEAQAKAEAQAQAQAQAPVKRPAPQKAPVKRPESIPAPTPVPAPQAPQPLAVEPQAMPAPQPPVIIGAPVQQQPAPAPQLPAPVQPQVQAQQPAPQVATTNSSLPLAQFGRVAEANRLWYAIEAAADVKVDQNFVAVFDSRCNQVRDLKAGQTYIFVVREEFFFFKAQNKAEMELLAWPGSAVDLQVAGATGVQYKGGLAAAHELQKGETAHFQSSQNRPVGFVIPDGQPVTVWGGFNP